MMNTTKRSISAVWLGALASVAAIAGPVAAGKPAFTHETGTYGVTGVTVNGTSQVGSYTIVDQSISISNDGALSGPSVANVVCAFATTGEGACVGTETFTGSIGGRTGSATFAVGITVDATGFHGAFVALTGSGGLAGLVGSGTFEGGATGTNAFDYAFR